MSTELFPDLNDQQQSFIINIGSNFAPQVIVHAVSKEDAQKKAVAEMERIANMHFGSLLMALNAYLVGSGQSQSWHLGLKPQVFVDIKDVDKVDRKDTYVAAPSNTVLVAFRKTNNVTTDYVVAIAGTNANSAYATFTEDGKVIHLDKWPYGDTGVKDVRIAKGSRDGVDALLYKMGDSLVDYLAGISDENINLIFTGHSLGGGLCPALALAIMNPGTKVAQQVIDNAKTFKWTSLIQPTAAPDIGNAGFVSSVEALFKPQKGTSPFVYNRKIWNSLDMVPHAWSQHYLKEINTLYDDDGLKTPGYVKCLIDTIDDAIRLANLGNPYRSLDPKKESQFKGKFKKFNNCSDCKDVPEGLCEFMTEVLYQHIPAYAIAFGLPKQFADLFPAPNGCAAAQSLYIKDSPCAL